MNIKVNLTFKRERLSPLPPHPYPPKEFYLQKFYIWHLNFAANISP